jgi:hypothetical protein
VCLRTEHQGPIQAGGGASLPGCSREPPRRSYGDTAGDSLVSPVAMSFLLPGFSVAVRYLLDG